MRIEFGKNSIEFYEKVYPFLEKREIENNLFFIVLENVKKKFETNEQINGLLSFVEDEGEIQVVAICTPPRDLLISHATDLKYIKYLAEKLNEKGLNFPGVLAMKNIANLFAKKWKELKKVKVELIRGERIYELRKVNEKLLGDKEFVVGVKKYENLILKWTEAMLIEAEGPTINEEIIENTLNLMKSEIGEKKSNFYLLLDDNEPVSMARKARETPKGVAINMVYTPPEFRRRGYATECVAKLSKLLLDDKYDYCCLFTDLSNPTSNKIYQQIGYKPIVDLAHYKFLQDD